MLKAKIKTRDGTRITVEGPEREVKKLLSLIKLSESAEPQISNKQTRRGIRKMSIGELLQQLKDEGFFDNSRSLVDIKNALAEKGRPYPVTTLSAQVIRQVRKGNLTRVRSENKWTYKRRE